MDFENEGALLHEALHATLIAQDVFDKYVVDAAAVEEDAELSGKAKAISEQIGELYQMIGEKTEAVK